MDLEKFIAQRPYLYHLTSKVNAANIITQKQLFSANQLITLSNNKVNDNVRREKRLEHYPLMVNGTKILLRDQRPISPIALGKCLTDGWVVGDFLNHLNDRVFMWPTLQRLGRHYKRYVNEEPVIFRFPTSEIIRINSHVKFCRLNSGATRANSYLGGKPPERGAKTFLPATEFTLPISAVAEVTFETQCDLPDFFSFGYHPEGPFNALTI